MSTRVALIFASFVSLSILLAQEESPPPSAPAAAGSPAAASPASTTPPLSASVTPAPSSGAPQLSDVLFKNLKARSIGPAVMGGRVSDIAIDPRNPFVFYVAAMGHLWADGGERGLYKTTDGGKTWKLVLQATAPHNARTGCGDVILDPGNPQNIYAALYARQRTPWSFTSGPNATGGEDVGGIFKSTNGGATWKKIIGGLPAQTGRIGLAVSASNPKIVMAVVQSFEGGTGTLSDLRSKSGGVFRSEDGGEHWTRMSAIDPRPFYFSQIRIDPANDQRVYLLQFALLVSDDGGKNFREDLSEKVHPDCHALAIQPGTVPAPKPPKPEDKNKPPKPPVCQRLLLGTDGGLYQSFAGGKNWDHLNKFPGGEFYRISLDDSKPFFRIGGGLQ